MDKWVMAELRQRLHWRERERERERFFFGAKLMWQKKFFFGAKRKFALKKMSNITHRRLHNGPKSNLYKD